MRKSARFTPPLITVVAAPRPRVRSNHSTAFSSGPAKATRPLLSINTASNCANASELGEWIVASTVTPLCASARMTSTTSHDVRESSPLVGSSRNSTRGRVTSATPMLHRFACPPEILRRSASPTTTSSQLRSFKSSIRRSTYAERFAGSSRGSAFSSAWYLSVSLTVSTPRRASNCSTYAATDSSRGLDASDAPKNTEPETTPAVLRPETTSRSVVFPAPLGPMSAETSPGSNTALTSWRRRRCVASDAAAASDEEEEGG